MINLVSAKTNFTSGQISPELFGRGDLKVFANGSSRLENVAILPTGGVSRRHGLRYIDELEPDTRLVAFEFNTEQVYLLCFSPQKLKVYKENECIAELEAPWNANQIKTMNWTQSADTLLVVHPDVPPKKISRNNGEVWLIEDWVFYKKDSGALCCPFYNFYQKSVKLTPLHDGYEIAIDADADIFTEEYIGRHIKMNKGEGEIIAVNSPHQIIYRRVTSMTSLAPSVDWEEEVFTPYHGYPRSVTFHQDRMVIGGSKSLPNHLWLSRSSDLFNFDVGEGKDDDAIDFSILSDQVNAITQVVSTRHLLVFTTGAEWMVTGQPLTPESIQLNRQTNIGTYQKSTLPPQNIDGATLFVSQTGRQLREFLFADVEQAYQARDLTLLSSNIISKPVDIAYHQDSSILYLILEDGTASCLTAYRTEEVNAWCKFKTAGELKSIAVIGDDIYFCVKRGDYYTLEVMDREFYVDCGVKLRSEHPQKLWSGFENMEGQSLNVVADDYTVGCFKVEHGCITLREPATEIIAGLPYEHFIEPLPYMVEDAVPFPPRGFRVVNALFRLLETQTLNVNLGHGFSEIPLKKTQRNRISDTPLAAYTGDLELRSLGWIRDLSTPMWQIKSDKPGPFTLLGVVTEIKLKQ